MFIIADEDMPLVRVAVSEVLCTLANGAKRCDKEVQLDDPLIAQELLSPLVVSGYWVVDTIRIDVRIKK